MNYFTVDMEVEGMRHLTGEEAGKKAFYRNLFELWPYKSSDLIILQFPEEVESVASSWVDGFLSEIGVYGSPEMFYCKFRIDASEEFKKDWDAAMFY